LANTYLDYTATNSGQSSDYGNHFRQSRRTKYRITGDGKA
jgi:hypothetical protein